VILIGQPELRELLGARGHATGGAAHHWAAASRPAVGRGDGGLRPAPACAWPGATRQIFTSLRSRGTASAQAAVCRDSSTSSPTGRCSAPSPNDRHEITPTVVRAAAAEVAGVAPAPGLADLAGRDRHGNSSLAAGAVCCCVQARSTIRREDDTCSHHSCRRRACWLRAGPGAARRPNPAPARLQPGLRLTGCGRRVAGVRLATRVAASIRRLRRSTSATSSACDRCGRTAAAISLTRRRRAAPSCRRHRCT
jgi:hypothetical protein